MADNSVGHLDITGVTGESKVSGFDGKIKINAWGFGGSAASTVATSGGSSAPGRPTVSPLWVTFDVDSGGSDLYKLMVDGEHKQTGTLSVQRIGTKPKKLVEITLTNLYVTSWGIVHDNKDQLPQVQVQFTYGTIKYNYFKQQDQNGQTVSAGPVSFSPVENKLT